mgnify:CR=1 FL=1
MKLYTIRKETPLYEPLEADHSPEICEDGALYSSLSSSLLQEIIPEHNIIAISMPNPSNTNFFIIHSLVCVGRNF